MTKPKPTSKDAHAAGASPEGGAPPVAAPVARKASMARNLMLGGLALSFIALFQQYAWGDYNFRTAGDDIGVGVPVTQTASGFTLKPHAVFILVALAAVFGTDLRNNPFVRRWGYWLALLPFAFATCNGFLSFVAFVIAGVSAFLHTKEIKQAATEAVM